MKKIILLLVLSLLIISCTSNLFTGVGATPDSKHPYIDITSHTDKQKVVGMVTLSGKATDDIKVASVTVFDSVTGKDIGNANLSGENWSYTFNTDKWSDGVAVFGARVKDKSGKKSTKTVSLTLDNWGPVVVINQLIGVTSNPFQTALTLIDDSVATDVEWKIESESIPSAVISGAVTNVEHPEMANGAVTYIIDPSPISGIGGFVSGYCTLSVRAKNTKDKWSKEWATKRIYINFSEDDPTVYILNPTAIDAASASKFGSDMYVSGQAIDDDGINYIYIYHTNEIGTETMYTIDCTVDPKKNKNFSYRLTGLNDGTHKVRAMVKDIGGKSSAVTVDYYFKIDSSVPTIEFTAPVQGGYYKGTFNITANITDAAPDTIVKVETKINNGTWTMWSTPNVSSYSFSRSFNSSTEVPAGGEVTFYIRATDGSGNPTESSLVFTVDNALPTVTISNPAAVNSGLNQTITISGTAVDTIGGAVAGIVESVKLSLSGVGGFSNVTPNGKESWSYDFDTSAIGVTGNDPRTLTVTVTDKAGNVTTTTRVLNIDQTADFPKVVVSNLAEGDTRLGTFTLAGTSEDDDAVASVWVSLDNTTSWVKASGTTSWNALMDFSGTGSHVLYYKSVDIYGKESHQKPGKTLNDFKINFTIDMDAPEVIITSPGINEAKGANPVVTGTVKTLSSKISKIEIKVDGSSNDIDWTTTGLITTGLNTYDATFSYTVNSTTAGDGPTKVYVRATDAQNRVKTTDREFIIDTVKPTGSFISPAATTTPYRNGIITFTGTAGDPDPSSGLTKEDVQIDLVGITNGITYHMVDGSSTKISGSTSNWTYNFDLDALTNSFTDGLYNAVLYVRDKAGNVATQTASTVINNIRISRYTPYFTSLTLNGTPVSDNMNVTKTCTFAGTIKDENVNDVLPGIASMTIYQSDDDKIDGSDITICITYYPIPTSQPFSFPHTFTSTKKYLIYELTDRTGGVATFVYKLNIDIAPPTADFKYSSVGLTPTTVVSVPGYSASYWIKLDAKDTLDGVTTTDITGSTINVKLGTTSGGDDLASEAVYTVGDYFKIDLKDVTATPIYLGYKLRDKVGNVTDSSISISVDPSKPVITSAQLSAGWVNSTALSGTATFGGATASSVKLTAIDETAGVNEAVWYAATGTTTWNYTLPSTPAEGVHNITLLATAADATNMYGKYTFKFDQTPPSNTLVVSELSDSGRVVGNNLSGTVRFSGVYADTMAEFYNTTDIVLTLTIDGVALTVPSANITKNADYSMSWYYDWNSQTHSSYNAVKNNIAISMTSRDAAGNSSVTSMTNKNVVPYITTITPVIGKIVPVKGYNGSTWTNLNDNKTYTYRLGSGSVVVNGYNLNSPSNETIYYNSADTGADTGNYYTVSSGNMNTLTLPLNAMTSGTPSTTGYIYIKVPGTSTIYSNTKKIVYIKNYAATAYDGMADMDMVPDTNNFARVIYQKHQSAGSGLYRFTETAEGTFNRAYNQSEYIFHGYNRFWFVNVTKDIGTSSQGDGTYYLFTCDSENRDSATKGLQLIGNNTMFDTLPGTYQFYDSNVRMPNNDYSDANAETRRNRWRMSTYNTQTGNPYVTDWNVSWGDTVAKNDIVYTAWYDELGSKLHYRRLNNNSAANTTAKSPVGTNNTDSSIIFNIKGMFPSITLDNSGYPVIACFDETNGNLVVLSANSTDPQNTAAFTQYTIDSTGVVGAYPAIKINGTNIHIAYQDTTNGYLKYAYGTSFGAMSAIELDIEGTPGYKCDIRLDGNNKPVITYIANSYIGTGNAVRGARFTDSSSTAFGDRTKWEVLTLPCERNITTNKVRGYITGTSTIFGFAKSGGTESGMPEFFREKP